MTTTFLDVSIHGISPLLMHSRSLINPTHPLTRALKEVTSKRKKTEADLEAIVRLEWEGGLYLSERGVYLPSEWIESMVRDGAKKNRKGKDSVAGVYCVDQQVPLIFPDHETLTTAEALWASKQSHVDCRPVRVGQARVMRSRPIFDVWSAAFRLAVEVEVLNPEDVETALRTAGQLVGLGDYRPKYGRFIVDTCVNRS